MGIEVLPDLYCSTIQIINICLVGSKEDDEFVLVDTGMLISAEKVISNVEQRFEAQGNYFNTWSS